jgi:sialic acid synthase SpsE/mannose-6-phosphate isomerase-like protein (cupin superfamily)
MQSLPQLPLFVFEMANNHMGRVDLGLRLIEELRAVAAGFPFTFAVKLQYRELDTFIHPDYRERADIKYVKRFMDTRLSDAQFRELLDGIRKAGFVAMCTPFDEPSVDRVVEHGYDVLKIGSCSLTDWPLLERAAKTKLPVIVSTAGASLVDIDRVVSFFQHREKAIAVMHCVGEYPTRDEDLRLNEIDRLRNRYPDVTIGYSTHEHPNNASAVQLAIAKGARIFEKHVGLPTDEFGLNDYSASPEQVRRWLEAAHSAFQMCGEAGERPQPSATELATLRSLRRGVFATRPIAVGEALSSANTFLAIPTQPGQLTANDLSKYTRYYALTAVDEKQPIDCNALRAVDTRDEVHRIEKQVKQILRQSNVVVPGKLELEISHHYGIDRFDEFGAAMVTLVNREYCKKLIVQLPGQTHPEQHHKVKEETFHVLWGDVTVMLDGVEREARQGDIVLVERGVRHAFRSSNGVVIEELSSTHHGADSYYTDENVTNNKDRKTLVTYWLD